MRIWLSLAIVLMISAYAGVSHAFPHHGWYNDPASGKSSTNRAGGGGIFGTGGAQDYGIKCSSCHIDNKKQQGMITIDVATDLKPVKVGGQDAYQPGMTYNFVITMMGEQFTSAVNAYNANVNGLGVAIEDANGKMAGVLTSDSGQTSSSCPSADPFTGDVSMGASKGKTTVLFGDCHGILSLEQNALTQWKFSWKAPTAGTGPITIYVGMVDGNSDGESSLDDDVAEVAVPLLEGS